MSLLRWAGVGAALLLFGACGPCGGSAATSGSSGNGCAHPGVCLAFSGAYAGKSSGLVQAPDCIPGGGLDALFVTKLGNIETSIEILVVDPSVESFRSGTFQIKSRGSQAPKTTYASIWVKPDQQLDDSPEGWSSDIGGTGTVVLNADKSGTVENAEIWPARGGPEHIRLSGTFNCS